MFAWTWSQSTWSHWIFHVDLYTTHIPVFLPTAPFLPNWWVGPCIWSWSGTNLTREDWCCQPENWGRRNFSHDTEFLECVLLPGNMVSLRGPSGDKSRSRIRGIHAWAPCQEPCRHASPRSGRCLPVVGPVLHSVHSNHRMGINCEKSAYIMFQKIKYNLCSIPNSGSRHFERTCVKDCLVIDCKHACCLGNADLRPCCSSANGAKVALCPSQRNSKCED